MTRAKERLIVTHATERRLYGYPQANLVSRFVEDIPQELIERQGMVSRPSQSGRRYVSWDDAASDGRTQRYASDVARPMPERPELWKASGKPGKNPYYNGAVVRHAKFGIGTVQRSEGTGDDLKVSVSFPGHGVKTLAVKHANLEVI
jgi:DNA helicase-2/ATP-dependent DNA helicase PcrA